MKRGMEAVGRTFEKKKIPAVWVHQEPVRHLEIIGCVDFEKKKLSLKSGRPWRVHMAGQARFRRSKIRMGGFAF